MNQYRCETCEHLINHDFCLIVRDYVCEDEENWIKRVGCASHSDFQSERDDLLDKLEQLGKMLPTIPNSAACDREALLYIPACTVNKMNKIIGEWMKEELRKAGEP